VGGLARFGSSESLKQKKKQSFEHHPSRNMKKKNTYVGPHSSAPGRPAINPGIHTQTPLCKRLPQRTKVLAARHNLISLNDGIARIKEARTARLKFHGIDNESIAHDMSQHSIGR
jgi:hypothetical protein